MSDNRPHLRVACEHRRFIGHPVLNGKDVSRLRTLPEGVELCPGGYKPTTEELIIALEWEWEFVRDVQIANPDPTVAVAGVNLMRTAFAAARKYLAQHEEARLS